MENASVQQQIKQTQKAGKCRTLQSEKHKEIILTILLNQRLWKWTWTACEFMYWSVEKQHWSSADHWKNSTDPVLISGKTALVQCWSVEKTALVQCWSVEKQHCPVLISGKTALVQCWPVEKQHWSSADQWKKCTDQALKQHWHQAGPALIQHWLRLIGQYGYIYP